MFLLRWRWGRDWFAHFPAGETGDLVVARSGNKGENAGGFKRELDGRCRTGGEHGGEGAEVRFVPDDSEVGGGWELGKQAGDLRRIVLGLEKGLTD